MRIESYGSRLGLNFNTLGLRDFPVVPWRVKVKGQNLPLPSETMRHLFSTVKLLPQPSSSSGFNSHVFQEDEAWRFRLVMSLRGR